ncbi:hypothetical protein RQP46_010145 [Phenoliferia psychrophenolica]
MCQTAVPYNITISIGGLALDPTSLGSSLTDISAVLSDLLQEISNVATCVGDVLTALPDLASSLWSDLTNLPAFVTSLIGGIPSAISTRKRGVETSYAPTIPLNPTVVVGTPTPTPTATATPVEQHFLAAAQRVGVHPLVLRNILDKYGVKVLGGVEDVEAARR